jgi:trimethylamine--corrinoid protein Co-methyltransferase
MMKPNQYPGKNILQGLRLDVFSDDGIQKIDRATRDVLSNYGIQVSDDEGLKLFKEAGAIVDMDTKMVKIPDRLVRQALQSAPSKFYLYGREERRTFEQEHNGRVHYTCFGTGIQVCNYLGNGKYETRDSNDDDLAKCAKLVDWAENITYFSLPVSARDWAGKGAEDVHEMLTSLKNTTKHFHHIDPVGEHVDYYWEILKAYYGGDAKAAREKPIMSMLVCPTSPLEISHNAAQVIIKGARYGIPVNVLSMAMSGGSSPVYLAGTLVTHNAEVLAGIVLSQIASPGARVWYGSSTTTFDLKRGTAPVGSPELGVISAAVAKLGQLYGLPVFVAGM